MSDEPRQILDGLFPFLESFGKSEGIPVYLEYFPDSKNTAMCVKRNADVVVHDAYIGGGYKADMNFSVLVQLSRRDTKNLLNVSRTLFALESYMYEEQNNGFPNIDLGDDTKPISLTMTSLPADYEGEGVKLTTFMAGYTLKYEQKGKWE